MQPSNEAPYGGATSATEARGFVSVPEFRARKGGPRLVVVTAYDATFAHLSERAGVDALLVGDSLGMVVQGESHTLGVTVDDIVYHTRAVKRGARTTHVIADMPFLSYQVSTKEALRNAGRMLREGGAHAVKLEGGAHIADTVRSMVQVGIPVMGHIGLTPQSVHAMGGFKIQGRTPEAAERLLVDARSLEAAGVYALVLEGMPSEVAATITRSISVPTIGIGAGASCDGQVLVGYDLLGLTPGPKPRFVERYETFLDRGVEAVRRFGDDVRSGAFPAAEHGFRA